MKSCDIVNSNWKIKYQANSWNYNISILRLKSIFLLIIYYKYILEYLVFMKKILKFLDLFLLLMRRKGLVNKMAEIKMNFRQRVSICEIMRLFFSFFFLHECLWMQSRVIIAPKMKSRWYRHNLRPICQYC